MPKLREKNGKFYFKCNYHERELPQKLGFKWEPKYKCWFTENAVNAKELAQYADDRTIQALSLVEKALSASSATGSSLVVPKPDNGYEWMPHQIAGVEWCVNRPRALIADEMGIGKSAQAIGTANYLGLKRILVICPASVKINWEREFGLWSTMNPKIAIINGTKAIIPKDADVIIINYDIIHSENNKKQLMRMEFDLLIADEVHYVKSVKSKRTKALFTRGGIASRCKRQIYLSGTPMLNRPMELYALLKAASPQTIEPYTDYFRYARRYCGGFYGQWGFDVSGATRTDELNHRLRSTFMIRRTKDEVMKDLPDCIHQIITFEKDKITKKIVEEETLFDITIDQLKAQSFKGIDVGELAKIRHDMALAKLPQCIAHIQDLLEGSQQKILVFAHHRDVIDTLVEKLNYNSVVIKGGMTTIQKQKSIDEFQDDPECRLMIANIQAGGVGINLTAASHVVFVETSWVPAEIDQAIARCWRKGQKSSVLAQFLVVRDSIDEHLLSKVYGKQKVLTKILDKKL